MASCRRAVHIARRAHRPVLPIGLMPDSDFLTAGKKTSEIDVEITYRIIELFSEGLYSSPHKAVEELVSNAFDAGATRVHVILSPDLQVDGATIAVIDDGEGMGLKEFKQHWLIGESNKRKKGYKPLRGRAPIGKFGIGKLATYVLAEELTHVSRRDGEYYATSMDFKRVPISKGVASRKKITLPFRKLTQAEARAALAPWLKKGAPGYDEIQLFGNKAPPTWTVAILSSLREMAQEIQRGRLEWLLEHAMPLREDFNLYLDGKRIVSRKEHAKKLGTYVLGTKDIELQSPAPDDATVYEDQDAGNPAQRIGIQVPSLGRVSGVIEIFEDPIDVGKSEDIGRSNGFFVFVRGRLVNADDPGFGIDRNKLRHGTFSRFRMVIHADGLDAELRSSRERLRSGPLFKIARNIAHAGFNFARLKLQVAEAGASTSSRVALRVAAAPAALTRRPLAAVAAAMFAGRHDSRYITLPVGLDEEAQEEFVERLGAAVDGEELVRSTQLVDLSPDQGLAVFDTAAGILRINSFHPFVAYFFNEFQDPAVSLPLELFAMAEVLIEAQMVEEGIGEDDINEVLTRRDELLRNLASSTGKRPARLIARALEDASTDKAKLELEVVAAFNSLGFDAVPKGGKGRPDGIATAHLSAKDGEQRRYSVSLEAKSKVRLGTKVSAKTVGVSAIARQRDDYSCEHAIVAGPDFPTSKGELSALRKEIDQERKKSDRTITLIRIADLARLVRTAPVKRLGLDRIRELFQCRVPEDAASWVEAVEKSKPKPSHVQEILEAIEAEAKTDFGSPIEWSAIRVVLRKDRELQLENEEISATCQMLSRIVPELVSWTRKSVAINSGAVRVLKSFRAALADYTTS